MTIVRSRIIPRRNGIYKREKLGVDSAAGLQLSEHLHPLGLEHCLEAWFGDIACPDSIEVIAYFLVVGGDCLGYRAGGASYAQKPTSYFLTGTDLRERAKDGGIQVEGERF